MSEQPLPRAGEGNPLKVPREVEERFYRRLRYAQWVAGFVGVLRVVFQSVGWAGAAGITQILLAVGFLNEVELLRGTWVLFGGGILFFFSRGLWGLYDATALGPVTQKLGGKPRDLFLTASELCEENRTDEFRVRAIAQADEAFPKEWISRLFSGPWRPVVGRMVLSLFLLFVLGWKMPGAVVRQAFWPFVPPAAGILSVQPGNAVFPRGDDVAITVRVSTGEFAEPVLDVRSSSGGWDARSLVSSSPGVHTAVLRSLQETLDYRISFRGRRSARFRLTPFDPPKLLHPRVQVDPPAYTGRKTEVFENVLSLRVLTGSRLRWSLGLDPTDSALRLDGDTPMMSPLKKGEEWVWSETVDRTLERRLWARRPNGSGEVLLADLTMEALADEAPQVSLLAPNEDLQADAKDTVPLTADLSDDVGVAEAVFSFQINQGPWRRENWKRFPLGVVHAVVEKEIELKRMGLKAGDQVAYCIIARDGHSPAGEGRSALRRILIADYAGAHEKVLEDLDAFQKNLMNRLVEQRDLRETVAVSSPPWGGLLTGQRQVARRLVNDEERLKELLERMARDPGTDRGALLEQKGIAEDLGEVSQFTLPEADRSLVAQDQPSAERAMDRAIAELERISRLSSQSVRGQNTRQLLRDQEDLSMRAETLARSLAEKSTLSEAEARQFQETVRAMKETMERIRERVDKMQKNMSEEYLKNAKVVPLRFDHVSSALSHLNKALAQKNGAEALAAAKTALEELKEIERQLSGASQGPWGQGMGGPGSSEEGPLKEELGQLKSLIQRQETLLDRTSEMGEKIVARHLARQKADEGGIRPDVWRRGSFGSVEGAPLTLPSPSRGEGNAFLGYEPFPQNPVTAQVSDRSPIGNPHPLPAPLGSLDPSRTVPTGHRDPQAGEGERLEPEQLKNSLVKVSTEIADDRYLTEPERGVVPAWAEEQGGLVSDTRALSNALAEIAHRTALVSPGISRRVSAASDEMEGAVKNLRSLAILPAQGKQENVLDLLRNVEENLSNSLREMQSLAQSPGGNGAPSIRRVGGGPGGASGDVPIPRADDFRPPLEFRQEMMDSMKEVYPKDQEAPVQDYYRHWTK